MSGDHNMYCSANKKGENVMKQEPVAWAIKSDNDFTEIGFDNDLLEEVEEMYAMEGWKYEVIPPYTAPRELSDDEIITRYRELMARNSV